MKYVSIDIETTGLDPKFCDVIEIAAMVDDLTKPLKRPLESLFFHTYVIPIDTARGPRRGYRGEPYALSMHAETFRRIAKQEKPYTYLPFDEIGVYFANWCNQNELLDDSGRLQVAGKNFAMFDKGFLEALPDWGDEVTFRHRVIDPAMWFMRPDDEEVPDLTECLKRAGLEGAVQHTALEDAYDVIRLVRKGLLNEDSEPQ